MSEISYIIAVGFTAYILFKYWTCKGEFKIGSLKEVKDFISSGK